MEKNLTNQSQLSKTGVLVASGLLLLVFGFALMLALSTVVPRSNPVWFVGLLIIFGSALALIAIVFRWLGLHAPGEAFGLPSGSIRTLLAVGVMVLFAVFGLAAISIDQGLQRPAEKPLETTAIVTGDAATVKAEIARYKALNIVAVPASGSASGAELKLYRLESFRSQDATDLQKQIVTALVTLLTSVVSFYFGSRSVEASRDAQDKKSVGPTSLPEAVSGEIQALDTMLADLRKRLTALQTDKATVGNEAALAARLSQASTDLRAAEASRVKIAAGTKDLASGANVLEALIAAVGGLKPALAALAQLLTQAEALVAKG